MADGLDSQAGEGGVSAVVERLVFAAKRGAGKLFSTIVTRSLRVGLPARIVSLVGAVRRPARKRPDHMTTLLHGAHTRFAAHIGLCLTDDESVARAYAGRRGELATVEIDLSGLTVVEVSGYDRETNEAPGDREADRAAVAATGADVLTFEDEDERGRSHRAWRIVSQRAVDALSVLSVDAV